MKSSIAAEITQPTAVAGCTTYSISNPKAKLLILICRVPKVKRSRAEWVEYRRRPKAARSRPSSDAGLGLGWFNLSICLCPCLVKTVYEVKWVIEVEREMRGERWRSKSEFYVHLPSFLATPAPAVEAPASIYATWHKPDFTWKGAHSRSQLLTSQTFGVEAGLTDT